MASVVLSVRVDEALAGWVVSYAEGRGASKQAVLLEAVQQFREVCAGGVPDLPVEPARVTRDRDGAELTVAPAAPENVADTPPVARMSGGVPEVAPAAQEVKEPSAAERRAQAGLPPLRSVKDPHTERAELFARLRTPASIKGGKKP